MPPDRTLAYPGTGKTRTLAGVEVTVRVGRTVGNRTFGVLFFSLSRLSYHVEVAVRSTDGRSCRGKRVWDEARPVSSIEGLGRGLGGVREGDEGVVRTREVATEVDRSEGVGDRRKMPLWYSDTGEGCAPLSPRLSTSLLAVSGPLGRPLRSSDKWSSSPLTPPVVPTTVNVGGVSPWPFYLPSVRPSGAAPSTESRPVPRATAGGTTNYHHDQGRDPEVRCDVGVRQPECGPRI